MITGKENKSKIKVLEEDHKLYREILKDSESTAQTKKFAYKLMQDTLKEMKKLNQQERLGNSMQELRLKMQKNTESGLKRENSTIKEMSKKFKEINSLNLDQASHRKKYLKILDEINTIENNSLKTFNEKISLEEELSSILKEHKDIFKQIGVSQEQILHEVNSQGSSQEEINILLKQKLELLNQQATAQEEINDFLKEQMEAYDNIHEGVKKFKNIIASMAQNPKVWMAAAGALALKQALEYLSEFSKEMSETRKELGLSTSQMYSMALSAKSAATSADGWKYAIGSGETLKAMAAITEETGNISKATGAAALNVAVLADKSGVSVEKAAEINTMFTKVQGASQEWATNTTHATINMARAYKIPLNKLTTDIAENSSRFAGKTKEAVTNMVQASAVATKIGLTIKDFNDVFDNALDLETQWNKEAKMAAMTGHQMSLNAFMSAKARGDDLGAIKAMSTEIQKIPDSVISDPIRGRAVAEAFGMTQEQLVKIKQSQQYISQMTNEQAKIAMQGGEIEGNKLDWIQKQLDALTLEKVLMVAGAAIALFQTGIMIKQVAILKTILGTKQAINASDKANAGGGGIGGMMGGMSGMGLLKGAAAMVVFAGAVFVIAKAFQEFTKVDLKSVAVGLTAVIGSMIGFSIAMNAIGAATSNPFFWSGIAALGVFSVVLLAVGKSIDMIMSGLSKFVTSIGGMFVSIGESFKIMSDIPVKNLVAITGALLGMGAAGLMLVVGIPGLLALSGALAMIGLTTTVFASGFNSLNMLISTLADSTPMLVQAGIGFSSLAAGIMELAVSLMALTPMIPTMLIASKLTEGGLGTYTEKSMSASNSGDNSSLEKLVQSVDGLVKALQAGGVIEIDGKEVGRHALKYIRAEAMVANSITMPKNIAPSR